ncbi:sigma-70 family RNA polymerase sigma factor [Dermatobacter hominis]|uniref:sigma-70 family RNA polymerase sigma factor n=1 Tax=Dermatobacter hominis TaxID=2884263 RepID=UPI001D124A77|nr:sigma-70 family RNA polymerase sigma factor [Dermatobacter hominis]UDY35103.1 sigma-70 family RNA polymerase sigma factor [Dermatobacter hominis]
MATTPAMQERFEEERPRLVGLATRVLGSRTEAEDAVQEVWFRLGRVDATTIDNPGGWLTTVTARVCLNVLRSRDVRREDPLHELAGALGGADDPVHEAVLSDAVGLALGVVLERLSPVERVAFVLHDLFAVPYEEIAPIVDRSVDATRQLASRARRRVRGVDADRPTAVPDAEAGRRRDVVDAFFAAARRGDLTALVAVLHPDVVLTSDRGLERQVVVRGAEAVAGRALMFSRPEADLVPVRAGDEVGVAVVVGGRTVSLMLFSVTDGAVRAIEAVTDREVLESVVDLGGG